MTLRYLIGLAVVSVTACAYSQHPAARGEMGVARSSDELVALLDTPGPVTLQSVDSADWSVPLSGLVNLEHPRAVAAGLVDGPESIVVQFHVIKHPTRGVFIVDTGVERAAHNPDAALRGLLASEMKIASTLQVKRALGVYLAQEGHARGRAADAPSL